LKSGMGVVSLRLAAGGGPISLGAETRAGTRLLRFAQRISSGFVEALDFGAVKPLIPDLQPRASRRGEPPVVSTPLLGALRQEQFCRGVVVEIDVVRHGALAEPLFVLKLFQCHRSERSSIAHATLRKLDDLPGNEPRCGVVRRHAIRPRLHLALFRHQR
jgi:hypothetical protein